jgi:multidrug efflux system membrane fusion protein
MTHRTPYTPRLAAALLALLAACAKQGTPPPSSVAVTLGTVSRADVPLALEATGTVEPVQSVAIQAQVGGILTHVAFREGQDVRQGDILFEIDPRPYRATLNQAEANLARDAAQFEIARRDQQRFEALAAKEYVTQQQLDQTRANTIALAATLRADTAAAERARIDLQNATIRAPISGRTGGLLLKEGNLVRVGSGSPLVLINQLSPILARFSVPASYVDVIRRKAEHSLGVLATPVSDTTSAVKGTMVFLDNAVDSLSGTVTLKASFPNSGGTLWPGNLVRVVLQLDLEKGALVVPRAAVQSGQAGDVIWTVDSSMKARIRKIKVVRTTDSLAVIAGGVEPGEQVVVDGQLRLTDGAKVSLRSEGKPK